VSNGEQLCTQNAKDFYNVACCICSHECPSTYRDDGLYCGKPSAYGRGVGYPWKFGDEVDLNRARERCLLDNPILGCEQWGLIIYPKCREGFHNVGCCVCSPDCPEGWTDIGVSCKKPSNYGRGVGYPWHPGDCEKTFALQKLHKQHYEKLKFLTMNEDCSTELIEELRLAAEDIIENKDEKQKLYDSVYKAAGVISKIQNKCELPTMP